MTIRVEDSWWLRHWPRPAWTSVSIYYLLHDPTKLVLFYFYRQSAEWIDCMSCFFCVHEVARRSWWSSHRRCGQWLVQFGRRCYFCGLLGPCCQGMCVLYFHIMIVFRLNI
jgi:hypothetical protein